MDPNRCGVERFGIVQAQGPSERATTLRGIQTSHPGMQPGSPTGKPAPEVRNQDPGYGDDAKQ